MCPETFLSVEDNARDICARTCNLICVNSTFVLPALPREFAELSDLPAGLPYLSISVGVLPSVELYCYYQSVLPSVESYRFLSASIGCRTPVYIIFDLLSISILLFLVLLCFLDAGLWVWTISVVLAQTQRSSGFLSSIWL